MLLIESALMIALLLLAFIAPRTASTSFFGPIERALARLARRRGLSVLVVGATALALRAAVAISRPWQRRAVRVKDLMSGFFLLRRECITGLEFQPTGFKPLLEILAKARASIPSSRSPLLSPLANPAPAKLAP